VLLVAVLLVGGVLGIALDAGIGTGVALLAMFVLQWLYGVGFETLFAGQTPGKRVLDLRVVRIDGARARFPDLLLRNLVRAADFLPFAFGVGFLVMVCDARFRRLGDLVAGTVVITELRGKIPEPIVLNPPVSEGERQALPARVDLNPQEIEAIEQFLRRRRSLSGERAEELAEQFAPRLSERTGVVAESAERVLVLAYARATGKDREP
jgi:RDD family